MSVLDAQVVLDKLKECGHDLTPDKQAYRARLVGDHVLLEHPTTTDRNGKPALRHIPAQDIDYALDKGFKIPPKERRLGDPDAPTALPVELRAKGEEVPPTIEDEGGVKPEPPEEHRRRPATDEERAAQAAEKKEAREAEAKPEEDQATVERRARERVRVEPEGTEGLARNAGGAPHAPPEKR